MGKRQRRRNRQETQRAQPPRRRRLAVPGPFMICRECRAPLSLYSSADPDDESRDDQKNRYLHPLEFGDAAGHITTAEADRYGHDAAPVEGTPREASLTCDFCNTPSPRWVFVPRRPIQLSGHDGAEHDYSSPWSCCTGCLQAVRTRNIARMLDRAMNSPHSTAATLTKHDRPIFRAAIRELYAAYLASAPSGPYELRIRPEHRPAGKRRSLRGISRGRTASPELEGP